MEDTLDHNAMVISGEQDEVAAMDRLSQAFGEVIPSRKCARSFLDAGTNSHQLIDE